MKKTLPFFLLLAAALLLAGCGSQTKTGDAAQKSALPLREAVNAIAPDAAGLVSLTAEDLADVMGIEPGDYQEAVYLQSTNLGSREIVAIRAKDAQGQKQIVQRLEAYLEQRRKETRNYLPDAYKLLADAKVESKNLTVVLFVGEKSAEESAKLLAGE
ncbi:MAG: DUF4358 domain-containing protein [Clostridia bacterium]|nr:DUF4358 domain-containing protein [Clostridia bacterium]